MPDTRTITEILTHTQAPPWAYALIDAAARINPTLHVSIGTTRIGPAPTDRAFLVTIADCPMSMEKATD